MIYILTLGYCNLKKDSKFAYRWGSTPTRGLMIDTPGRSSGEGVGNCRCKRLILKIKIFNEVNIFIMHVMNYNSFCIISTTKNIWLHLILNRTCIYPSTTQIFVYNMYNWQIHVYIYIISKTLPEIFGLPSETIGIHSIYTNNL